MTSENAKPSRRYLSLTPLSKGVGLTFTPTFEVTSGSGRRSKEITRRIVRLLRKAGLEPQFDDEVISVTVWQAPKGLQSLLAAVDAEVDAFRNERLHPKEVEEILAITARERRRWTKDGRLPTSGHTSFRRGQNSIHLLPYPPDDITSLAGQREQIEAWRRQDQQHAGTPADAADDEVDEQPQSTA